MRRRVIDDVAVAWRRYVKDEHRAPTVAPVLSQLVRVRALLEPSVAVVHDDGVLLEVRAVREEVIECAAILLHVVHGSLTGAARVRFLLREAPCDLVVLLLNVVLVGAYVLVDAARAERPAKPVTDDAVERANFFPVVSILLVEAVARLVLQEHLVLRRITASDELHHRVGILQADVWRDVDTGVVVVVRVGQAVAVDAFLELHGV